MLSQENVPIGGEPFSETLEEVSFPELPTLLQIVSNALLAEKFDLSQKNSQNIQEEVLFDLQVVKGKIVTEGNFQEIQSTVQLLVVYFSFITVLKHLTTDFFYVHSQNTDFIGDDSETAFGLTLDKLVELKLHLSPDSEIKPKTYEYMQTFIWNAVVTALCAENFSASFPAKSSKYIFKIYRNNLLDIKRRKMLPSKKGLVDITTPDFDFEAALESLRTQSSMPLDPTFKKVHERDLNRILDKMIRIGEVNSVRLRILTMRIAGYKPQEILEAVNEKNEKPMKLANVRKQLFAARKKIKDALRKYQPELYAELVGLIDESSQADE